jgi:hypothetical protein
MPDDLHARIKVFADDYGTSVNELINMACEEFIKTGQLDDLEKRVSELECEVKELKSKSRK